MMMMMMKLLMAGAVLVAAAVIMPPAEAQSRCAPRDTMVKRLQSDGERQRAIGLKGTKALFEIWVSEKGTWTVLMIRPDGTTCRLAEGTDWRDIEPGDLELGEPN